MSTKKPKNYLNNKDMLFEIEKFHINQMISKTLHMMFFEMAKRIARKETWFRRIKFVGQTNEFIHDMINDAYIKCITNINGFNIEKKNPFSFFTSVICNHFKTCLWKEEKQQRMRNMCQERHDLQQHIKFGIRKANYENFSDG